MQNKTRKACGIQQDAFSGVISIEHRRPSFVPRTSHLIQYFFPFLFIQPPPPFIFGGEEKLLQNSTYLHKTNRNEYPAYS